MSCDVGVTDVAQIWSGYGWLGLWPAVVAPIRPLAWELSYAEGVALKSKKKKEREQSPNHIPG